MVGLMVEPLSLKQIRKLVACIKGALGISAGYVDIVRVYEHLLQEIGIDVEIVPQVEMGNKHAETILGKNTIRIREDVYNQACAGYGRDRFTLAHELGHLLLHRIDNVSLARNRQTTVAAFCDPEWQANAFAGEFLAPYDQVKKMEIPDIVNTYGITDIAARVQKYRRKNGGL